MRLALLLTASLGLAAGCVTQSSPPTEADSIHTIDRLTRETCGSTFSLQTGDRARSGAYVVSVFPEPGRGEVVHDFPSEAQLRAFVDKNKDLLDQAQNSLGTYCEREQGDCLLGTGALTCYLDVSRQVQSPTEAARLAVACNQKSIAHLSKNGVEILDSVAGKGFGDGKPLTGAGLEACKQARGG